MVFHDSLDNDFPAHKHYLSYPRIQLRSKFTIIRVEFMHEPDP